MTCCFIGHKEPDREILPTLIFTINNLVGKDGIDNFYIGNNGWFDRTCFNLVRTLQEFEPQINYNVVLAYYPDGIVGYEDNTIYPEGLELVPKRFAIKKRNEWMIDNSDYVICHVKNSFSNAHKFREYAIKKNKKIIDV